MFDSFARGFKMIYASIKMGLQDQRLLFPSILTVFTNFAFAILLFLTGRSTFQGAPEAAGKLANGVAGMGAGLDPGALLQGHQRTSELVSVTALNGPLDAAGFGNLLSSINTDGAFLMLGIACLWWMTTVFLEGVTTALVYSHLTEGPGSGKFSIACRAVIASMPAIICLGMVTLVAKTVARWLRKHQGSGIIGFGFLAGIVQVFWTLAGHLILPSIVIEGTSFWGALKRADRVGSGNLLTIGIGEVGVDTICRVVTFFVFTAGVSGFGLGVANGMSLTNPVALIGIALWAGLVVLVTAASVYIRSAFYTCLYVWALEAEAVHETQRVHVRPPAPLAHALA